MTPELPPQRFTIFHGFFSPFFSKEFYVYAAKEWRWRSYIFLLMLTVAITMPGFSHLFREVEIKLEESLPKLIENLPTITIKDGKAEVADIHSPTEFVLVEDGQFTLILLVDLEANKKSVEESVKSTDDKAYIVLSREAVFAVDPSGEVSELSLKDLNQDVTISKENIAETARTMLRSAMYFGVPLIIFFLFIYRLFLALIFALLADSMKPKNCDLSFSGAMTLGIMVVTPSIILSYLFEYLEMQIPLPWLVYAAISFCYLKFALSGLEETQNEATS